MLNWETRAVDYHQQVGDEKRAKFFYRCDHKSNYISCRREIMASSNKRIAEIIKQDLDEEIIKLRKLGFNDEEICEILELSFTEFQKINLGK